MVVLIFEIAYSELGFTPLEVRFAEGTACPARAAAPTSRRSLLLTGLIIFPFPIENIDKVDGISMVPLIENRNENKREFVFAESTEKGHKANDRVYFDGIKGKWRTWIEDEWKIIYIPHPERPIFELYNLKEDPKENKNLIDGEKEIAQKMEAKISESIKNQGVGSEEVDMTEKSKKLLRKLGYID